MLSYSKVSRHLGGCTKCKHVKNMVGRPAQDALAQVEAENAEKAALDTSKAYDRQIP